MTEPTVYIIDDDPSARRGLTRLLRAAGLNAESYPSAETFLASENCVGPGCILLDVSMPEMTGPELQQELSGAEYCMPIVFLSAHADVPTTAEAMKKGAVDFLAKPADRDDLLNALRASLSKDEQNRAQLAEKHDIDEHLVLLTPREHEVMTYVITGMPNKAIAFELNISEETVKIHRGRVMHKLGIVSLPELVRMCETSGVAPTEPPS